MPQQFIAVASVAGILSRVEVFPTCDAAATFLMDYFKSDFDREVDDARVFGVDPEVSPRGIEVWSYPDEDT